MNFHKYQALGNTYLVIETAATLTPADIRTICSPHYGLGADGILAHDPTNPELPFQVTIFNPDGSEAEKSGNGLRIFARYLWDELCVADEPFQVETAGGTVTAQAHDLGQTITVQMGHVTFYNGITPVNGSGGTIEDKLTVNGRTFDIVVADIGNPHCVILTADTPTAQLAQTVGPHIETHQRFPNRTNVQFMKIIDPCTIQLEIWERGAGYTLASGSSSCAAAAVAHKLGRCENEITVLMPSGSLTITIDNQYHVTMHGPVVKIASGYIEPESLTTSVPSPTQST